MDSTLPPRWTVKTGFVLLFISTALCAANAQLALVPDPNERWKKDIEALKLVKDYQETAIQFWNGQIVAEFSTAPGKSRFFSFTADTLNPRELVVPRLDEIISLGSMSDAPVALGKTKGRLILLRKKGEQWAEIPNDPKVRAVESPRIIPAKTGLAILTENRLLRFIGDKWLAPVALPAVPEFSAEFTPAKWGARQVLYGSQLVVGWAQGLYGLVATLDVNDREPKWKEVSGKKGITRAGIVENMPVTGMTIDLAGNLWISEGTPLPLGGDQRGLFRFDGTKWSTVVRGENSGDGVLGMPGPGADFLCIADVFAAPDGKLYVLPYNFGILNYESGKLNADIAIYLSSGNEISIPKSLVVDARGDIFVTTNDFGILCFTNGARGRQLKQVILPAAPAKL